MDMRKIKTGLLAIARPLLQCQVQHFMPRYLKNLYWQVVLSNPEHQVYGSTMLVSYDQRGILLGDYESEVAAFLKSNLREGMIFCDVGANMGVFSLFAARLVGPSGRIIAVEPDPANAALLRKNIALNQYWNIELLEKAIAENSGTVELYLSKDNGSHSFFPINVNSKERSIWVESVRLDSVPDMDRVDFLKVDVEGAELTVLRSLGDIRPATVVLEYYAERAQAAGNSGPEFLDALRAMGYSKIRNLDNPYIGLTTIEQGTESLANLVLQR